MIRPCRPTDKSGLLQLLRLNTPRHFYLEEELDFIDYLDQHAQHYFVVDENGTLTACGGINYFEDQSLVRISWDIIHPDH